VPTPFAGNQRFDLLHGDGGPGPKQVVANSSDRLFGRVFVQTLRALAPVYDAAADLPGKNCIMRLIQQVGLAPQQFQFLFALSNITRNFCSADDGSFSISHRGNGQRGIYQASVFAPANGFIMLDAITASDKPENCVLLVMMLRWDQDRDRFTDRVLG